MNQVTGLDRDERQDERLAALEARVAGLEELVKGLEALEQRVYQLEHEHDD